ncbi:MAG: hypothetical protein IKF51_01640, partial [Solobacterium sp.]|nr:hypothetical protein [Solobacterium sp.]
YDGELHGVNGYTISLPADSGLTAADILGPSEDLASASGTAVDTYPMNLQASYFQCLNDNYDVTFSIVDGWLKIIDRRTALVTITVNSAPNAYTYDGTMRSVHGYTYTAVDGEGNAIDSSQITVSMETPSKAGVEGIDAGTYTTSVEAADFTVSSSSYDSCEVVRVVQGTLVIDPASLTISVTGATQTVPFDGKEHTVTGYTVTIPAGATITESEIIGPASAAASGTEVGTYSMGLAAGSFSTENTNYNVTFSVTDGSLVITPPSTEHVPPTVSIIPEMSVLGPSGSKDIWVGFQITAWNDLEGGTMKATLMISDDDGATYTASTHANGSKTLSGDYSVPNGEELQVHVDYLGYTTPTFMAKIALEYTYPDGTTGSAELGPLTIRTAKFAYLDTTYGTNGATIDAAGPVFDLIIDDTSVDPDDIGIEYSSLTVNGTYIDQMPQMRKYPGNDGKQHMQLAYAIRDVTLPVAVEWNIYLTVPDGSSVWTTNVSYSGTINE